MLAVFIIFLNQKIDWLLKNKNMGPIGLWPNFALPKIWQAKIFASI
jgi:hypothetical protein